MSTYKDIITGEEYDEIPKGKVQPYIVKGQAVTEGAYDRYYNEHPTELDEVVVLPDNVRRKQNEYLNDPNFPSKINRDAADRQVRRTAFTDENTLSFWLHALSPSQQVGAVIDGFQGGSYGDYVRSLTYGNSGIFTDNYAVRHPIVSTVGNIGFDILAPYSWMKSYRYATTPQMIGQGAEKEAWLMNPLSREVTLIGGDPAYIAEQSNLPRSIKYTSQGVTKDGRAVTTAPRVIMKKNPSRSFIQDMHRRGFFRMRMPGDTERVYVNPRTWQVILDAEYGWSPWLGEAFVDSGTMPLSDYAMMIGHRKGGKLIAKYKK